MKYKVHVKLGLDGLPEQASMSPKEGYLEVPLDEPYMDNEPWSVSDFEERATWLEGEVDTDKPLYDRTKFKKALEAMVREEKYSNIDWYTIEYYLDLMCKEPLLGEGEEEPEQ